MGNERMSIKLVRKQEARDTLQEIEIIERHFNAEYHAGVEGVWDSQFCHGLSVKASSPDRGEFLVRLEGDLIGKVSPWREWEGKSGMWFAAVPECGEERRRCGTFGSAVTYLWHQALKVKRVKT